MQSPVAATAPSSPDRPPSGCHPSVPPCSAQADTVRAFLAASAEGFCYAAAHPAEAATLFVQAAAAAHPNLPQPLEEGMCRESLECVAKVRLWEEISFTKGRGSRL